MLRERHSHRIAPGPPRTSRAPHRNVVPLEVGIIPGNRFILLPLKKVSKLVCHPRCRGSSATSTKTCIVQKAKIASQSALLHTAPTSTIVSTGDIIHNVNDLKNLRPAVRSSIRLSKRVPVKRKHRHPAILKSCLSPVSEQEQEENFFISEPLLDPVDWKQENNQPLNVDQENMTGPLHKANVKGLATIRERNFGSGENEVISNNRDSKAETRATRKVSDISFWSEDEVSEQRKDSLQDENARRLDTHNELSCIPVVSPDRCEKSVVDNTDKICIDGSVPRGSRLQETQNEPTPPIGIHGASSSTLAIDCLSMVLIEFATNSSRSKQVYQQFCHPSSRFTLAQVAAPSGLVITNCNCSIEGSQSRSRSKDTTIVQNCLDRHPDHVKQRYEGLKGAMQSNLLDIIRKSHGGSLQDTTLTALIQSVAKNKSLNGLLDELQEEDLMGRLNADRVTSHAVRHTQDRFRGAAARKQEDACRGDQIPADLAYQRPRIWKKLHKVVPKIQTFGKNRVSPSSRLVRPRVVQVKSIGHQFLTPPQISKNSVEDTEEFDGRKVSKCGRPSKRNENACADQGSPVHTCSAVQKWTYLKGFLCSFASENDLPIGPLFVLDEQLLN